MKSKELNNVYFDTKKESSYIERRHLISMTLTLLSYYVFGTGIASDYIKSYKNNILVNVVCIHEPYIQYIEP